ncbi:MAG: DUF934 domain-containing protein [Erythrobacter sp.]
MTDNVQFRFRDDNPSSDPVAEFSQCAQSNATAVRIEPGDDALELLPCLDRLTLVEVNFPVFGDGRGYSSARSLREAGFTGELRAVGDVAVDQLFNMRRCGFDAFAPDVTMDEGDANTAFSRWEEVYQAAADDRQMIANLRHE